MSNKKKEKIYEALHQQLSDEYLISPKAIELIRGQIKGHGLKKKELLEFIEEKNKNASAQISLIMNNMSYRHEAEKWLNEVSDITLQEMLDRDIER
jgi:hypothetical protein